MSSDDGRSATDIITYIGVPLAVLGVLPILYNTFATLVSLSRIKRMLRHSRLTAITRSDVVNRVIEIELPRYAVMPLDRFENRSEYWTLSPHPSSIQGGSWTTFNWRTNAIGIKTQRVEYVDQVRQPQVEVAFDELVSYLLDLGAVPDAHGWKLLRSTGLWTPVGCSLMSSPDGRERALTVAPSDDSDGNLSLAVAWSSTWITRNYIPLPPYWVRLPTPPRQLKKPGTADSSKDGDHKDPLGEEGQSKTEGATSTAPASVEMEHMGRGGTSNSTKDITCQISLEGIVTALTQQDSLRSTVNLDSLYIEHLRIRPGKSDGVWFASAVTAYGTSGQTMLWNYKIPDEILHFSRKETVPCGVMVLLEMVDESDTPEWASQHNDRMDHLEQFTRRAREQGLAMAAEAQMPPAQKHQAAMNRQRLEAEQRMQDMHDQMKLDQTRRDQRTMEALQSPKWDTKLVAAHTLLYLKRKNVWAESLTLKEIVGFMLHRMVLEGEFAAGILRMLDVWRAWGDMGGMRKTDYTVIREDTETFANATLLVALIKDASTATDGTLAMDLQECLRIWRKVRLG